MVSCILVTGLFSRCFNCVATPSRDVGLRVVLLQTVVLRCFSFALQIARGLHYLHSVNVVHLDVKPANIIATPDCRLRLADFGCCHHISPACEVQEDRKQEVDSGSEPGPWKNDLEGTLAYRAPELLKGDPPSHRADIYSLGITLWQMVRRQLKKTFIGRLRSLFLALLPFYLQVT